jgi:glycosyltransferase involved in cell wall biosynthesis
LGVGDLFYLDDEYRSWSDLHALIRACDVVLLPYDSREQVTSGVLVEALASGKPVVATAFPHALEVVADRAGIVVPHEAPGSIAVAIEQLFTRPALRQACAEAARREGMRHAWPTVGAHYDAVLRNSAGIASRV